MSDDEIPTFPTNLPYRYPVTEAWHDYRIRVQQRGAEEPATDDPARDFQWRASFGLAALLTGVGYAITALETRLYEMRLALGLPIEGETPTPSADNWSVPDLPRH